MTDLELRIVDLLRGDQNCQGNVLNSTVRDIALLLQPRPESRGVIKERAACVAALEPRLAELQAIHCHEIDGLTLVDGAAFVIERRRLAAALEGLRLGLHRQSGERG